MGHIFSRISMLCLQETPLYMSSEQQTFDLLRCGFAVKSNLVFKCASFNSSLFTKSALHCDLFTKQSVLKYVHSLFFFYLDTIKLFFPNFGIFLKDGEQQAPHSQKLLSLMHFHTFYCYFLWCLAIIGFIQLSNYYPTMIGPAKYLMSQ